MPDQYEPFTPQFVDEQIEQFMPQPERQRQASTPETELVKDMHDLYREYAGTRDRVRRRLQEQMASRSRATQAEMGTVRSLPLERQRLQRKKDMYSIATSPVKTRTFKPRLALVAATLFAALLVVSLIVIAPFMRSLSTQPHNPAAANNQTPTTVISQPKAVYISDSSGILKLNPTNGTVYISVDHPDIVGRSLVFALRATDGKQLNNYDLPLSIEQLTVAGGFLYPMGYENFYGVNLATRATWHITGSQGANQGFSYLHVV